MFDRLVHPTQLNTARRDWVKTFWV